MAKNSTERLGGGYDLKPRGSVVSIHRRHRDNPPSKRPQVWYYADFKGMIF